MSSPIYYTDPSANIPNLFAEAFTHRRGTCVYLDDIVAKVLNNTAITEINCFALQIDNKSIMKRLLESKHIECINLRKAAIPSSSYERFLEIFLECPHLRRLDISDAEIVYPNGERVPISDFYESWAAVFLENQTITELTLWKDHFPPEQASLKKEMTSHTAHNKHRLRQWQRLAFATLWMRANKTHTFRYSFLPVTALIEDLTGD